MMFHRRNMDKNRPRFKTDKRFLIVVALAIVFTAAVLRAPITSMGALCVEVQDDLGLSSAAMGLVTTLPLLAFAASALFMSALSERFGKSRVLAFGCTAIIIGILLRSFAGPFGLFFGTILLGFGISSGNVLLPSVVRDNFPAHVGVMTALYTTTISVRRRLFRLAHGLDDGRSFRRDRTSPLDRSALHDEIDEGCARASGTSPASYTPDQPTSLEAASHLVDNGPLRRSIDPLLQPRSLAPRYPY